MRRTSMLFESPGSLAGVLRVITVGDRALTLFYWYWFRKRTSERVASQVLAHAAPGKIIVIHDGHHRNPQADRRYAIEATRRIIEGLQAQRYEFSTLCEIAH